MVDQPIPYPLPKPLERLYVHEGLMMNAERWQIAHRYHRQRQNLQYQALYQPGIVYGLGVKVIEPPQSSLLRYRSVDEQQKESRWLEIQPGIALDIEGNPIVVDPNTDRTYRIAIDPPTTDKITVYVVVSYVDPDTLEYQPNKLTIPERFRFDQKTSPPNEREVELCRVDLAPGGVFLKTPKDIFSPGVNELNLLHRVQAQSRSQTYVHLGVIAPDPEHYTYTYENCQHLMQSLSALYPTLQGTLYPLTQGSTSRYINLRNSKQCHACDLLFAHAERLVNLNTSEELETLKTYLETGGVLLVESPTNHSELDRQVREILQELQPQSNQPPELSSETVSPWSDLHQEVSLPPNHPLQSQPFTFASPPILNATTLQVAVTEGIILVKGALSGAWGIRENFSRSDIRAAQELGINFLYFAWQRRHLIQLMR